METIKLGGDNFMTSKELLYVEDALGHEKFMKSCTKKASTQLQDATLSSYMAELEKTHTALYDKFYSLF